MAVCSPQELLSANPCLIELNPEALDVYETQMLCNLFQALTEGTPVDCDIQTALTDGKCLFGIGYHMRKAIRAQLLCEIVSSV